jgi:anti-sigma regulatory factor (Ser/Thr protein kinase)
MAPPALPQPPDPHFDERSHGRRAAGPRTVLAPVPEPAHSTGPPGGERPGRLPGPEGPDRLASGAVPPAPGAAALLPLPPRHTRTFELPAVPASVRAARGTVREVLASWGVAEALTDSVVLIVSELVTNAVTHSGSKRIACRLHGTARVVRAEVEDQNRGHRLPAPRRPGPEEQSGRGLLLVGTLSRDWGVAPVPHGGPGRVVWAEVDDAEDAEDALDAVEESPEQGTAGAQVVTGDGTGGGGAVRLADPSWTATRPQRPAPPPHAGHRGAGATGKEPDDGVRRGAGRTDP